MRWNCPHCEELVTAGIDFENTKKAYVRCVKCNGMALVHRSAVLADYVKARRMEEEAQLEAELRTTQTATANSRAQAMETQIRGLNEKLNAASAAIAMSADGAEPISAPKSAATPPPPNAAMNLAMEMEMTMPELPTKPAFFSSFETMEEEPEAEITILNDVSAAPPVFMYSKPPAFLLKNTADALETLERSFSVDGENAPMGRITATPVGIEANADASTTDAGMDRKAATSIRSTIALWIAAAAAIASGSYLYIQGKKALALSTPATKDSVRADAIQTKANSAVRQESGTLAIVRVPRAILRAAPTVESAPVQTLERSSVARIVEMKDGWMRLESPKITAGNHTAWVRADLVVQMSK